MKKIIIPVLLLILYISYQLKTSPHDWTDIGYNDFPNMHTINFNDGLLQIVPWDIIIAVPTVMKRRYG